MSAIKYNIVSAGSGLSALSMASLMARDPFFAGKKILMIDRDQKTTNDRTWCFWAKPEEIRAMPPVIGKSWPMMHFFSEKHCAPLATGDYQYHIVRGLDFYHWAKNELAQHPGISWLDATISGIDHASGIVHTSAGDIHSEWILNSALLPFSVLPDISKDAFKPPFSAPPEKAPKGPIYLLQHFKGWEIRCNEPVFDPEAVTLMDFRVPQSGDTRFVYVLPFSEREALVEYTVFSPALLEDTAYEAALRSYLRDFLGIHNFEIKASEFGIIPMTNASWGDLKKGKTIAIGTAAGFVKGSSGYAFKRTQRRARAFVSAWAATGNPDISVLRTPKRFRVYDAVFLQALADGLVPAHIVFSCFFKNLGGEGVFRFLDEDTDILADFRALNAVPKLPFTRAALRQGIRLLYV